MNTYSTASKSQRALAYFIDLMICLLIIIILLTILPINKPVKPESLKYAEASPNITYEEYISIMNSEEVKEYNSKQFTYGSQVVGLIIVVIVLYHVLMSIIFSFQTVGRFFCKIKIVTLSNERPKLIDYIIREAIGFVITTICFIWVINAYYFFSKAESGLVHDNIAKLKMVRYDILPESIPENQSFLNEKEDEEFKKMKLYLDKDILDE